MRHNIIYHQFKIHFPNRIDIHFVIKIADFGLSEDTYSKNYFRQSTSDKSIKLPVKWMAPESLFDGVFSEKSDVVRLGVQILALSPDPSQLISHVLWKLADLG